jgi:hypothetical protein
LAQRFDGWTIMSDTTTTAAELGRLRVLDLFSGLDGWGEPFREAGHRVFAIDHDQGFTADAHLDIGDLGAALAA